MRSGELLGLKRTDLDRTSQTLHIQRSVDPSGELVPIKEVQISGDTTRTKRVPLLDPALEAIDQWLDSRSDWGWPADADLSDPVSPHQVRHSVNDALREAGVSVDVRRAILGHSSDDTNRGYTDPKATEALDGLQQVAEQLS
jgi:integrase